MGLGVPIFGTVLVVDNIHASNGGKQYGVFSLEGKLKKHLETARGVNRRSRRKKTFHDESSDRLISAMLIVRNRVQVRMFLENEVSALNFQDVADL